MEPPQRLEIGVAVSTNRIVGFRRGKRGTSVSTYRSIQDFSKGLVAARIIGPAPGDFIVDQELNKYVVSGAHAVGANFGTRLLSITSPKSINFDLQFSSPTKITLDELKLLVKSAITSSKASTEYWEESGTGVDTLLERLQRATSFDEVGRLLRH